jgi:hypothetical protein
VIALVYAKRRLEVDVDQTADVDVERTSRIELCRRLYPYDQPTEALRGRTNFCALSASASHGLGENQAMGIANNRHG